ncbi:MAG: hemolysin family protein [Verrucomicrobiota bacterium]
MNIPLFIMLIGLGLIGSAFFSGIETGVFAINRIRLKHLVRKQKRGAKTLEQFLSNPDHLLGTVLVGNNLCNIIVSVAAASLGTALAGQTGNLVAYICTTLCVLICCEYLPKAWFQGRPAVRILSFAGLLKFAGRIFYPVSVSFTFLARILVPVRTPEDPGDASMITRDEFLYLTRVGEKAGTITRSERRQIAAVFALEDKTCAEIMIPRKDMVYVHLDSPVDTILSTARKHRFSRLPVYDDRSQKFTGIVYVYDLFSKPKPDAVAKDYLRPPQIIPSHTRADEILPRMRMSHQPLAMIVNERDEVIGLLSLEDVLEEIVGEF